MKHLLYFIPISIILTACGGGSVTDDCIEFVGPLQIGQELPEMYCSHNKTTMPVQCTENPKLCV